MEKVTLPPFGTVWLKGWTSITGGGPLPRQSDLNRQKRKAHSTAILAATLRICGCFFVRIRDNQKPFSCHFSKTGRSASTRSCGHFEEFDFANETAWPGRSIARQASYRRWPTS